VVGLAVEAKSLSKRYGQGVVAVDGLDLDVRRGEVYGLLGPNGAGKTTTIRMLLGLVRPSSGLLRVLGEPAGRPAVLARMGTMGETAFHPFLSGRDNLRVLARRAGVADARVSEVLQLTSMAARGRDGYAGYSLGMKQRLGVAAALLKDPELLVLDEPSNGLDPAGQLEMHRLIEDLSRGGRTIVLSSHQMDEVEALCDRVGVIGGGRMLAEGTPEQLRGAPQLWVHANPARDAAAAARGLAGVLDAELDGETLRLRLDDSGISAAAVNRHLVQEGLAVSSLSTKRRSLQEAFLELTGGRSGGFDSIRARSGRSWRDRRAGARRTR